MQATVNLPRFLSILLVMGPTRSYQLVAGIGSPVCKNQARHMLAGTSRLVHHVMRIGSKSAPATRGVDEVCNIGSV
ncbi:hypothetical protein PHLCEN_2v2155 [Hermanssonia centrifuga]|uniref:Secreted protein n=1 Tax=Hermanssonia centrifuga TaxID=98765 RepID=A0A2R6RQ06_9APHY|nr:hypothetical protein PHLCEN_2v2155 [Hermanssonia centrifuga]